MPRLLADVTPLRESRDFRLLYFGQMISFTGSQLTVVAVPYQVYLLTHSSLQVGLVSLAQLGPLIVGSLIGGAVVDSRDRRTLLLAMQVVLALTTVGLAVNAHVGHRLWPIYVLTAISAAFSGVDRPARAAVIPNLVDRAQLSAAFALYQVQLQVGAVLGPAVAGLLLGRFGLEAVYVLDVATFGAAFLAVLRMAPLPPMGGATKATLASVAAGLGFLKGRQALQGTFIIDLDAMVFGMPRALFPALGTGLYGGGASTVGLLFAAPGAGALIGAVTTGWVGAVRRQGLAVLIAVAVWGAAITLFGATSILPLGLLLLAVAGAADVVSAVFRNTILQTLVPDSLRGRLSAVQIAVVTGGPRLGDLESGAVATAIGAQGSVITGGAACVVGVALVAWRLREFRRFDKDALPGWAVAPEPPTTTT